MFSIIRNGMEHKFGMKDDMIHGKYYKKDSDGNILISCNYTNGVLNGLYERWVMVNGARIKVLDTTFTNGHINGTYKTWYPCGRRYVDCAFLDGKYNGSYTRWHKDGTVALSCNFIMGKKAGKQVTSTYANGMLHETYRLTAGGKKDGIYASYYPSGKPEMTIMYENGVKNGFYKKWWENGIIFESGMYHTGRREGIFTRYYSNGVISSTSEYHDGSLNGYAMDCYQDGSYVIATYRNGKLSGARREYYHNGNKNEFSYWRCGMKHGPYLKYDIGGVLTIKTDYVYDKVDGKYEEWFSNGRRKLYNVYKNGVIVERLVNNETMYDGDEDEDETM